MERGVGGGLSRRDLLRGGTGWAVAGFVVGCSGGDGGDGDEARGGDGAGPATTARVAPGDGGGTVTIRDVRIFDGATVLDADTLVVEGGLITAVGQGTDPPRGSEVHAGDGGFLLPGLIDAHGHTNGVDMLADALRFGTTTVLDIFSPLGANHVGEDLRAQRAVLTPTPATRSATSRACASSPPSGRTASSSIGPPADRRRRTLFRSDSPRFP